MTNGNSLDLYANNLKIKDTKVLFKDLRYLVQEYLFESVRLNNVIKFWIEDGISFPFIQDLRKGDYLQGADKDLVDKIYPVLNMNNKQIAGTDLRIDTGNETPSKVARMRLVNNLNYVNKKSMLFNGTGSHEVEFNPFDKAKMMTDETNGM